jgi:hypothetical protein
MCYILYTLHMLYGQITSSCFTPIHSGVTPRNFPSSLEAGGALTLDPTSLTSPCSISLVSQVLQLISVSISYCSLFHFLIFSSISVLSSHPQCPSCDIFHGVGFFLYVLVHSLIWTFVAALILPRPTDVSCFRLLLL